MRSWLRLVGLNALLMCTLVATVLATQLAAVKPDLPLVLLDSFDRTFEKVYDAAERKVSQLEATARPPPPRRDVRALLRELDRLIASACDAATARLDTELVVGDALSPERRHAVLGCIERHLDEARRAARCATDPELRDEYLVTCDRLREVRRLI